jgi:hypothetical protein
VVLLVFWVVRLILPERASGSHAGTRKRS